jgi:hypothetical protein
VSEELSTVTAMALTVREHMLLQHAELRGDWFTREGRLRHVFGCSPTLVHAELLALIDRAEAEAAYPVLVHRLRRLRAARQAQRSQRRLAG